MKRHTHALLILVEVFLLMELEFGLLFLWVFGGGVQLGEVIVVEVSSFVGGRPLLCFGIVMGGSFFRREFEEDS